MLFVSRHACLNSSVTPQNDINITVQLNDITAVQWLGSQEVFLVVLLSSWLLGQAGQMRVQGSDTAALQSTVFTQVCLEHIRKELHAFSIGRHRDQYHTPRNLLLALIAEVGHITRLQGTAWCLETCCAKDLCLCAATANGQALHPSGIPAALHTVC